MRAKKVLRRKRKKWPAIMKVEKSAEEPIYAQNGTLLEG